MELHAYLNAFHSISPAEFDALHRMLKYKKAKKGELLLVPGQVQKELYFVKSGIQMSYFETEKSSHVMAFTYAPGLCAVPDSFSLQIPSRYFLTCITDSELESITFQELENLFNQSPNIERLFRKMTEQVLAGMINRHFELHAFNMEERYKTFCRRSPHLLGKIPHKYIASYLSISPTNFSKLYNNIPF